MLTSLIAAFSALDAAALALLAAVWAGVGRVIEHPPRGRASVSVLMRRYRRDWMREMAAREVRIFDAAILSSLRQGTTFMTSAAMIAVGGALALAGNAQRLGDLVAQVGGPAQSVVFWQAKLGVVILLLTHAVFKFIWSNRLFGYSSVVMAAVPNVPGPKAEARAARAAELNIRAALNFNRGLRSVYFAFAALGWILGPWGLILAVAAVGWTLLSREFASTSRGVLSEDEA